MKSAYELAMERLEKASPLAKLTDSQKERIAAVEEKYNAKIAERRLFLTEKIAKAKGEANYVEVKELEEELTREIARVTEKAESEKEKIRNESSNEGEEKS